jgi:ERCC4-type nuclease
MELIIDNRENIKELFTKNENTSNSNLELGDYLIKYNNQEILVIERKTIADYCASIKDGRNREQKKRLLSNYSKNQILYLIEGPLEFEPSKYNRVTPETVISSITNTIIRDGINVFHTKDPSETVFFIENICKKISKQGISFIDNKSTHSDDLFNNLTKSTKNANIDKELCNKLMLANIPTISIKTAERILMNFGSIKELINTLTQMEEDKRIPYIQNLPSLDEKFRKIPISSAKNIIKFLIE